jgi:hypothetical protein
MPQICLGVRLYPQTARIFNIIRQAGAAGISGHSLFERAYQGRRKPAPGYGALKAHIRIIRDAFEDSEYRIRCENHGAGGATYRLVKVVNVQAFAAVPSCSK